ncbi:branched-chain amino acid ABC transporter permease [Coprothermobacteraceae bacterium]|nr:branched-chain amino acid ABC transporter permease [Coprothermobacteraceae bacterium]
MRKRTLQMLLILLILFLVPQLLYNLGFISPYILSVLMELCFFAVSAVSLNLVFGIAGQFSLGQAAFMGTGAYVFGYIINRSPNWVVFVPALLAGGLAAASLGYLVGLPTLRLKGDYLGIATLALNQIFVVVIQNLNAVGGARGYILNLGQTFRQWWLFFGLAVISIFLMRNVVYSSWGRLMVAVREDEIAAESVGIDTTKAKIWAFVIGAFFAGIAGAMSAVYSSFLHPSSFNFIQSFNYMVMVILGGLGSLSGSLLGAGIYVALLEGFRIAKDYASYIPILGAITQNEYRIVFFALALILIMLYAPKGLMGGREFSFFKGKELERK